MNAVSLQTCRPPSALCNEALAECERTELSIEAREAREQEDREVLLLLELRTPVPGARQPPVDARARVEKVVGACKRGTAHASAPARRQC